MSIEKKSEKIYKIKKRLEYIRERMDDDLKKSDEFFEKYTKKQKEADELRKNGIKYHKFFQNDIEMMRLLQQELRDLRDS